MKALKCELCGGTEIVKDGDFFVCQSCGMKYTLESAKKMMVEGVVQVEGTVKTDKTADAKRLLTLAKTACKTRNFCEAERYADKVLEIDLDNIDAWAIKSIAIDWQLTIKNNRLRESSDCFLKTFQLLPNEVKTCEGLIHAWSVIKSLKLHLDDIVEAVISLYAEPIINTPSDDNLALITETLASHLEIRKSQWTAIGKLSFTFCKAKEEMLNSPDISDSQRHALNDTDMEKYFLAEEIPGMYFTAASIINSSVVDGVTKWRNKWENNNIFDYYLDGSGVDQSAEEDAFDMCTHVYNRYELALRTAIKFLETETEGTSMTGLSTSMTGLILAPELLFNAWSNICAIEELNIGHKTYTRAHGAYVSNSVKEGFSLNAEAITLRKERLKEDMAKRDEYDPEKKKERERAEKETELKADYWLNNPAKKEQKQALENEFDRLGNELRELKSRRSFFGPFEFKAKRECDAKIEQARERRREIKNSLTALDDELMTYVSNEIES